MKVEPFGVQGSPGLEHVPFKGAVRTSGSIFGGRTAPHWDCFGDCSIACFGSSVPLPVLGTAPHFENPLSDLRLVLVL